MVHESSVPNVSTTISRARPTRPPTQQGQSRLAIVYPPTLHRFIPITSPRVILGRQTESPNGIDLPHPTVSRQHAALEWNASQQCHVIADLGSRNGTWLNNGTVGADHHILTDNTVLRLGDVICVYERSSAQEVDCDQVSRQAVPGQSLTIGELRHAIGRAAKDPSPILLEGATGTGKELIAAEIHRLSQRSGELICVNCAALSPQLIESQLFGHEKGAFTGAASDHIGMFRAATGGTLFLDEIGEMPPLLQPKLLRAIQQGEVVPVGKSTPVKVDVRIVSATNRNLAFEVEEGKFRRDLFARLALWHVRVPSLAQRRADILFWLDKLQHTWHTQRNQKSNILTFEPEAAHMLVTHTWPDNLREIDRVVHELSSNNDTVSLDKLPPWLRSQPPGTTKSKPSIDLRVKPAKPPAPTKEELIAVLENANWNIRHVAREFSRDRRQIYRWMKNFSIHKP